MEKVLGRSFQNFLHTLCIVTSCLIVLQCTQGKTSKLGVMPHPSIPDSSHVIPQFSLINQEGEQFSNADLQGKVYVANFIFTTCPTICMTMTGNMVELQKMLAGVEDVHFVSHSVNPEYDSPEILKAYAKSYGSDLTNWDFLTGPKEDVYTLGIQGYYAHMSQDEVAPGGFLHSEFFILVDRKGRMRSRYDDFGNLKAVYDGTNSEEIKALYQDVKILLKE